MRAYVLDYFSLLNHVHTEISFIKFNCLKIFFDFTFIRNALLNNK